MKRGKKLKLLLTPETWFRKLSIFAILWAFFAAFPAHAVLKVDVTRGTVNPITIALTSVSKSQVEQNIWAVVANDLESSGLFRRLGKMDYSEKNATPSFVKWRAQNAQALAISNLALIHGDINVTLSLWDIDMREKVLNTHLRTHPDKWRYLAHTIADMIYKKFTGEAGYFNTNIVYVAETGSGRNRVKRLAIMDQDGANSTYLTSEKEWVLSPRFSPNQQMLAYLSYGQDGLHPKVNILNLQDGKRYALGQFAGMTFAPRFSPDGRKVVMSYFSHDASNIYTIDLQTRAVERLTRTPFIDTAPCFSPDGHYIVFESDRSGRQQLYIMSASGGGQTTQITGGTGSYATPVWSPRGDWIAFTKMMGGEFMIGVIRPNGTGERILARGYHNEGPTWSPNGRVIMFHRETPGKKGGPRLWSVDLTGYNERPVYTKTFASDPAWSLRSGSGLSTKQ